MEDFSFRCVKCGELSRAPSLDAIVKQEKKCGYCFKLEKERNRMGVLDTNGLARVKSKPGKVMTKKAHTYRCLHCGHTTKPIKYEISKCTSCTRKTMVVVKV